MARTISIGAQNYADIIEHDYFYIDKTRFIQEWWSSGDMVTLITRPRRFGKTLNISMLECFFSNQYENRGDLFEKKDIWKKENYRKIQGSYPVLSLSFANIKEKTYLSTRHMIYQLIVNLYSRNAFLLESDVLTEQDKAYFNRVTVDMNEADAALSLYQLSSYLYRYYKKKVIILLDEYDTPMQEAYVNGFWEELAGFARALFNATFKTNPWLERAIMTGVTRVSKESIFSDLNNMEVVTTTSEKYAQSFGFTEAEVFVSMDEYGRSERQDVKRWYDGFCFGSKTDIYNPWSILNYLEKGVLTTYWANTSSNSLVGTLLLTGDEEIKSDFETLLKGDTIDTVIDEEIVYDQLDTGVEAVWSLLLASGYVKIIQYELPSEANGGSPVYRLSLTNLEVKLMFYKMVRGWFRTATRDYNKFVKALLENNVRAMNTYMNEIALKSFNFFDTGKSPSASAEPERFYHGFVLGLIVELDLEYRIRSNRESGFGRYDVMLEPKDKKKNAYLLEFKVKEQEENSLEDTVEMAKKQIAKKQYAQELLARGIAEKQIYSYGFAFEGKQVLIG